MKRAAFMVVGVTFFFCLLGIPEGRAKDFPAQVKQPVNESIAIRRKTQKAEDKWAGERLRLKAEYERLEKERERLIHRNRHLEKDVTARQVSVEGLERDISRIIRVSEELVPFLEETHDRLAALVNEDVPFLSHERQRRLERVRQTLDDPLVSTGEKFRKVMEAVSIEAEYGNTIEVYREEILLDGKKIQADIFRLGRTSLFFQTLDRKTTGYLDPATLSFKRFPSEYNRQIGAAMEMGAKRRPMDLLILPLGRLVSK